MSMILGEDSDTPMFDPVCVFHGIKRSEHEIGRCLYCCICFETLTPEQCYTDESGDTWDVCKPCGEKGEQCKRGRFSQS